MSIKWSIKFLSPCTTKISVSKNFVDICSFCVSYTIAAVVPLILSPLPRCYRIYSTRYRGYPTVAVPVPVVSAVIPQPVVPLPRYCRGLPRFYRGDVSYAVQTQNCKPCQGSRLSSIAQDGNATAKRLNRRRPPRAARACPSNRSSAMGYSYSPCCVATFKRHLKTLLFTAAYGVTNN